LVISFGTTGAIPVALLRNRADERVESGSGSTSLAGDESTVGGAVGSRAVRRHWSEALLPAENDAGAASSARAEASVTSGLSERYAMLGRCTFG
jgi:hypothetical protein